MQTAAAGRVVAVSGSVVDIAIPGGPLPAIGNALEIDTGTSRRLVVEVQQHVNQRIVRGVAMQETAGLRSGVEELRLMCHIVIVSRTGTRSVNVT